MATRPSLALVDDAQRMLPGASRPFRTDVLRGLAQRPRAIPARWFYDDAGSALFDEITRIPEYYPTRVETALLTAHMPAIAERVGPGRAVIEFGAGSLTKTPLLLEGIAPACYVPIDISGDFLREAAAGLAQRFPGLPIVPVEADFTRPVPLPEAVGTGPRLGFFPGSTIGNLVPSDAVDLLRSMRDTLGASGRLLIGMDRVKPAQALVRAYDDAAGVTAAFNRNLVTRINRELGGTIPEDGLAHRAIWNAPLARIEMHLEATRDLAFAVDGEPFTMAAGETIHTENSHKYTPESGTALLLAGGWTPGWMVTDAEQRFMLVLADATPERLEP